MLVSAPTGSGKTLAAFMVAIDRLGRMRSSGRPLQEGARIVYVSPLRSLATDVAINLRKPLSEIAAVDSAFGEINVGVRTGDTPPSERAKQSRKPPDIVATTPESLALMLLSEGGRRVLSQAECVIVDELHAVVGSKRGPHLALSLELLEDLCSRAKPDRLPVGLQRIGLSATQVPIDEMARYLVGADRTASIVDVGGLREVDLEIEVPGREIGAVCSSERWAEIYRRIAELIDEHRSTLVFVSTRRLAERVGAHLQDLLGRDAVASHHGSLSRERRQDVETRLKAGRLSAVVATSSLELGIDIGDVDLVIQIGSPKSVTALAQRVGRSGHALAKIPKGRIFPLTIDELEEASAIVSLIRRRSLDQAIFVEKPLDVLAQQIIAACVMAKRKEDELFDLVRRAWPYRDLSREEFDAVVALHTKGRSALLHRDPVTGVIQATRRARMHCSTNSGTIPDVGEYEVVHAEEGTYLGSLDEDFAIESSVGDVFQLGNASWRVVGVRRGQVLVSEAPTQAASFPFWFGEGPSRTKEVGEEVGRKREAWLARYREATPEPDRIRWMSREFCLDLEAASTLDRWYEESFKLLGTLPTHERVVAERFFDQSGGMQMVIHSPLGSRINRAWGLSLRKKFCRSFGFELQAAAGDSALLISLSTMHSFSLEEAFDFLSPESVRHVLEQAVLGTPLFLTRWRWALGCSLILERNRAGKKVPINLQRTIAQDRLAEAFPQSLACFETLPPGDIPIPMEHPIVRQAITDCMKEPMDVDGLADLLVRLRDGRIERVAVDLPEPSPMAEGILSAQPYEFLDDAPLEERRTHGVTRAPRVISVGYGGSIDEDIAEAVRKSRWPKPKDAEELHHCLTWMGYVTDEEAATSLWEDWLNELATAKRVSFCDGRWSAVGVRMPAAEVASGRLSALGIVYEGEESRLGAEGERMLLELEIAGKAMRIRVDGRAAWADRAAASLAFASMRRRLRSSFRPVEPEVFEAFERRWQHLDETSRLDGPEAVVEVVSASGGIPIEAARLEREFLAPRIKGYRPEWLDAAVGSGRVVWFSAGSSPKAPMSKLPLCLVSAEEAHIWRSVWRSENVQTDLSGSASAIYDLLVQRGPRLVADLERELNLPTAWIEAALEELVRSSLLSGDSFGLVRWLLRPTRMRARPIRISGRIWALQEELPTAEVLERETIAERVASGLLLRLGIIWKERFLETRLPMSWSEVRQALRRLEERGEARWGRFVRAGTGEQFAYPGAEELLAGLSTQKRTASAG